MTQQQIVEATRTVPVFRVGEHEFDTREEAEAALARQNAALDYAYFLLPHDFDMCEGRACMGATIVAIESGGIPAEAIHVGRIKNQHATEGPVHLDSYGYELADPAAAAG